MPDATENSLRSPLRQKRGERPARSKTQCPAHSFVSDLFATLSAIRDSLVRIYAPAGINEHKFAILTALAAQSPEPSLATKLALTTGVTRASMTDLLDDLQRRGWIDRTRDRADRRIIRVHLTTLGHCVLTAVNAHYETLCRRLVGFTPPRDLRRLASLCANIRRASASLGETTPPFEPPKH